jgi:hypothetical protein
MPEANPNEAMYTAEAERQKQARQRLEEMTAERAKAQKAQIEEVLQPTPTQMENDLAALGVKLPDTPPDRPPQTPEHPIAPAHRDVPHVSGAENGGPGRTGPGPARPTR